MRVAAAVLLETKRRASVGGFVVGRAGGDIHMCDNLLESFPPQCESPSLELRGIDEAELQGIVRFGDVFWTERPVVMSGSIEAGILVVESIQ